MAGGRFWSRTTLLAASAAGAAIALLVAALSFLVPGFLSRDYDAKSLASLRRQAGRTRQQQRVVQAIEVAREFFPARFLPGVNHY